MIFKIIAGEYEDYIRVKLKGRNKKRNIFIWHCLIVIEELI